MQAIRFIFTGLILFSFLAAAAAAQSADDLAKSRDFENKAGAAYNVGDFSAFLLNMQKANELRPNHPRIIYNLADAYAIKGNIDKAITLIRRMALMGLYFPLEKDDDFKSLGPDKLRYAVSLMEKNHRPLNASTRAFTISDKEFVPEGIAFDPAGKRFFVSSIYERKIVSVDTSGKVRDFSAETDGLWSVLGMKVDKKSNVLWATTTAFPQMKSFQESDAGRSGIVKYDLASGKMVKKYVVPGNDAHALGDLTIDDAGNVFVTDSLTPIIYRIDAKTGDLGVFLTDPIFSSLQGLALTRDEKIMFVADYSKGIFRIDMGTRKITQLVPDENVTLLGIDGLYFRNGKMIATQNGISPNRVILIGLDRKQTHVTAVKTLEANHADFYEPSLGVIVDDNFYFIANGQISLVSEKGIPDAEKLRPPAILKLKP